MTYYGGKELARSFRTVRKNTIAVAHDIPAEKYSHRVSPEVRSVGELLTHIALSYQFANQLHLVERRKTLVGFDFPSFLAKVQAEEKQPRTKEQIIDLLRANGEKFASWLNGLDDSFLGEQVEMPAGADPTSKSRFEMLLGVKEHEMHHRAQLMVMERQLGIVPHLTREMQARFANAQQAAAKQPVATPAD